MKDKQTLRNEIKKIASLPVEVLVCRFTGKKVVDKLEDLIKQTLESVVPEESEKVSEADEGWNDAIQQIKKNIKEKVG